MNLQDAALHVSKRCGLFLLARFLTRRKVRILCYHGFAQIDEALFRPGLFLTLPTFRRRMQVLSEGGYAVTSLQEALDGLEHNTVRPGTVVITVDDVFDNFSNVINPILEQHGFPVTAYVTSYYSVKGTPVFRLVIRYMFWKSRAASLDLASVDARLGGRLDLNVAAQRLQAEESVIALGESLSAEDERVALIDRTAAALAVDIAPIRDARAFHIVTPDQIRELVARGVDIELHTHRHRFPVDVEQARREILDNREVLEPLTGRRLVHFCYPSGIWSKEHWAILTGLGVTSATTCESGLNDATTPRLGLKRILDAEDVSLIRFEAEVSGFKDLARRMTAWMKSSQASSPGN